MGNVWRSNTIQHCLMTKHFPVWTPCSILPCQVSHLSAFNEDKKATAILLYHDEINLLRLKLAKHVAWMYMKCMRLGSNKCKALFKREMLGDHCLGTKYVDDAQSGQTISNMFDHRPNEQKCLQCSIKCLTSFTFHQTRGQTRLQILLLIIIQPTITEQNKVLDSNCFTTH